MSPRLYRSLAAELLVRYPPAPVPAPPPRVALSAEQREAQRRSAWHSAAPDVAAVVAKLEAAGFSFEKSGRPRRHLFFGGGFGHCASVAIAKGHLRFGGAAAELDAPARSRDGAALAFSSDENSGSDCVHSLRPSLRTLLLQPDYAGTDYEDGLQEATVRCVEKDCGGATYVTGMCEGLFQED